MESEGTILQYASNYVKENNLSSLVSFAWKSLYKAWLCKKSKLYRYFGQVRSKCFPRNIFNQRLIFLVVFSLMLKGNLWLWSKCLVGHSWLASDYFLILLTVDSFGYLSFFIDKSHLWKEQSTVYTYMYTSNKLHLWQGQSNVYTYMYTSEF